MCAKCSSESSRPNNLITTHWAKECKEKSKKKKSERFNKWKSFSQTEMTFSPILAQHYKLIHLALNTKGNMLYH